MVSFKRLALFLGASLPASSAPALRESVEGKYIVTLKQDLAVSQIDSHIAWLDGVHTRNLPRRQTSGVNKVWTDNFKGYSGQFDEATLSQIRNNEDVRLTASRPKVYVDDDKGCCR